MNMRALRAADIEQIVGWRYPVPYDLYDVTSDSAASFFNPESPHFAVRDDLGELIGFLAIGIEARVPGGDYSAPAVDIGIGLRPDQTGKGLGRLILAQFIDEIVIPSDHPPLLRATIGAFNQRSLKTFLALGFSESARFRTETPDATREWVVVTRALAFGPGVAIPGYAE